MKKDEEIIYKILKVLDNLPVSYSKNILDIVKAKLDSNSIVVVKEN